LDKGKNFSDNSSKGLRKKSDFYETPYSLTEQLLGNTVWYYNDETLEPACGHDAITRILRKRFSHVVSYDVETDFLKETKHYPQCITNPPFSLAKEFILKAKEVIDWRFAFLLPLSYLHGQERYELKIYEGLESVNVFTRYPMIGEPIREDGKYHTGMMVYAWFIWTKNMISKEPVIKWIDNNDYVIRGEKKKEISHYRVRTADSYRR